jgi:integrating conjugative element protein (TIGR03757 family)
MKHILATITTIMLFGLANTALADSSMKREANDATQTAGATQLPMVVYIGNNQFLPEHIETIQQAGYTVGVYNLDAQRNLEESLVKDLPTDDPQVAERLVQQRFEALPVEDVIKVFQPAALLLQWDIHKIPVFVFNRKAAVYGVTDSVKALELWETWKNGGGE